MLNVLRWPYVPGVLLSMFVAVAGSSAHAQATETTPLQRQLSRLDLGVGAIGIFNKNVSGTAIASGQPTTVLLHAGNTLGALVTIRYTRSPFVGLEFNYDYSRYTDTYTPCGTLTNPPSFCGIQQNATEYTFGYVVHARKQYFGVTPFASVGAGTTEFSPTANGGQRYYPQARATYYYSVGAEKMLSPRFGFRVQFREAFFKGPDFETNYLTIQQQTSTIEPGVGFVFRY